MSAPSAERGQSANLDLLRAIAVALVLAQHLARHAYVDRLAGMPTSSWGIFGVLLFFVHTCLVLMYSMERSAAFGLSGWSLIRNFAIRRIFRIYPLSILAVLTALALHLDSDINGIRGLSHGPFPGVISAAANLLLVQNLVFVQSIVNVLWSLPFELQMYAFLPFLFLWIHGDWFARVAPQSNSAAAPRENRTNRFIWPLLGLWILSVGAAAMQPHIQALSRLSILVFIPCFLPGVVAYTVPHRAHLRSALWPGFILLLVVVFAVRPAISTGWVLCLLLGLMIPQFREIKTHWLRWISHRAATYSYGIYLSHQFCIWTAFGLLEHRSLALRVSVLVVMLVTIPVLLYYAIEKPMIRLGVQVAARWSNQPKSDQRAISDQSVRDAATKLNLEEEVAP